MSKLDLEATGPISLTGGLTVGQPTRAHRYFSVAQGLAGGLRPLLDKPVASTALCFLAAQVVETALKSYILNFDPSANITSPPGNHDLVALWARCAKAGLNAGSQVPQPIRLLGSLHSRPYPLRYSDEEQIRLLFLPSALDVVIEVEALLARVSQALS